MPHRHRTPLPDRLRALASRLQRPTGSDGERLDTVRLLTAAAAEIEMLRRRLLREPRPAPLKRTG